MSHERFLKFLAELLEAMPARELDDEQYERAIGYPWERRPGSCLVTDKGAEDLADIDAEQRSELIHSHLHESPDRVPLLAYGANSSPERLALKLAHLPESDHEALILAGDLEDFDVGAVAQPPVFSSMPATLISSPGTSVRVAVLFLTPGSVHRPLVDRADLSGRGPDGHHPDNGRARGSDRPRDSLHLPLGRVLCRRRTGCDGGDPR